MVKPAAYDFLTKRSNQIFIGARNLFDQTVNFQPFKDPCHCGRSDPRKMLTDIFPLHPKVIYSPLLMASSTDRSRESKS